MQTHTNQKVRTQDGFIEGVTIRNATKEDGYYKDPHYGETFGWAMLNPDDPEDPGKLAQRHQSLFTKETYWAVFGA